MAIESHPIHMYKVSMRFNDRRLRVEQRAVSCHKRVLSNRACLQQSRRQIPVSFLEQ